MKGPPTRIGIQISLEVCAVHWVMEKLSVHPGQSRLTGTGQQELTLWVQMSPGGWVGHRVSRDTTVRMRPEVCCVCIGRATANGTRPNQNCEMTKGLLILGVHLRQEPLDVPTHLHHCGTMQQGQERAKLCTPTMRNSSLFPAVSLQCPLLTR